MVKGTIRNTGLAMLLCLALQPQAMAGGADTLSLSAVADGVYVHIGQHRTVEQHGRDDIANLGVVIGAECVAVIDSGGSVAVGHRFRQAIVEITDKPVCYVINTHIHFDHVLGNPAFVDSATSFVGHWKLPEALLLNEDFFKQDFAEELGQAQLPKVDVPVQGKHELSLGDGDKLILQSWNAAHTHSDLTVLHEKSGVMFAGDLVFRERTPVIDGKLLGWIGIMEQLQQIPVKQVVPGHGPVADNWQDALGAQLAYLQNLRDGVRAAVAKGVFMEDAIGTVGQDQHGHWELFDHAHGRNVSKAFVELEWE